MSYNHRQAITVAEDYVLQLGVLLEKGNLSDLIHPSHPKSGERWRNGDFVILRNESEEKESDAQLVKIYTPWARELSGFMYRITDGAMATVLQNTDFTSFFQPTHKILANQMTKPRTPRVNSRDASIVEPTWELLALRSIIAHALTWLKNVKPKPILLEVESLPGERPLSFDDYLRRKADRGPIKQNVDKAINDFTKVLEELAAGVKSFPGSESHTLVYIAGIPGYLTSGAWFPQISYLIPVTRKQLEKVHKTLVQRKLDPAPAMSQLYELFLVQSGHLGVDTPRPSTKVKPNRKR
jgi:hypothetical protein